jgi:hypothetical protein
VRSAWQTRTEELAAHAVPALGLSLIFTLYLAPAPEKYMAANLVAGFWLCILLATDSRREILSFRCARPLMPLLMLLIYAVVLDVLNGTRSSGPILTDFLIGFIPYLLCYAVFFELARSRVSLRTLLIAILVVPGIIHFGYMCFDILKAAWDEKIPWLLSANFGWLEYIKSFPRVGRRYLSIALVSFFCGSIVLTMISKRKRSFVLGSGLAVVVLISIALMDARAAYFSIACGAILTAAAVVAGPKSFDAAAIVRRHSLSTCAVLAFVVLGVAGVVTAVGYSAGKSRWIAVTYSAERALNDTLAATQDIKQRYYVDAAFWDVPIDDIGKCYLEGRFRCQVDQSLYLRLSWLIEGGKSLLKYPFGIGYSEDYMGRLWGVGGVGGKYQRADNFIVEIAVSFGFVGIGIWIFLIWRVWTTLRQSFQEQQTQRFTLLVIGLPLLILLSRSLIDVISEGALHYLMALYGIFYGVANSTADRTLET